MKDDKYKRIGNYVIGNLREKFSGLPIHHGKAITNINYSHPGGIWNLTHILGNRIYKINYEVKFDN